MTDYLSVIPMITALILRPFYKNKYKDAWLICEEPAEARDNGYHFFKYMCEKQSQQKCFYAIKKKSVDYDKVKNLGETIEYGSVQHWLAYFICRYNISSQKGGKPNAAVCSFMELSGRFHPHNIFLQHGVTINDVKWLYADKSMIEKFITSTVPEFEFISNKFGYPEGTVVLTGFPRFDALHNITVKNKQILIMPTWRYWFNLKSKKTKDIITDFSASDYLEKWLELLNSNELAELAEEYGLNIIFYLHRNMQKYVDRFSQARNGITIASWKDFDIQALLKESSIMITDYSSVFFDMVYMKKPVIFYQFDEEDYRKYQYPEGYFDYHNNPFGKAYECYKDVLKELDFYLKNGLKVGDTYMQEHSSVFKYWDENNSERIFSLLNKDYV